MDSDKIINKLKQLKQALKKEEHPLIRTLIKDMIEELEEKERKEGGMGVESK